MLGIHLAQGEPDVNTISGDLFEDSPTSESNMMSAKYHPTVLILLAVLSVLTLPGRTFGQRAVENLVDSANALKARGDMNGAVAEYTKALQLNPKLAAAYYKSGAAAAPRVAGMAPTPTVQGPLNFTQSAQRQAIKPGAKGTRTFRMLKRPNTLRPLSSARKLPVLGKTVPKAKKPKIMMAEPLPSPRLQ